MKRVYICGDSFCVPDLEYGACWVDMLDTNVVVQNLAKTGASNLQISLQVDHAISQSASAIIVNFTSCTRQEWRIRPSDQSLYQQFCDGSVVSYVIPTCSNLQDILQEAEINKIRESYLKLSDLSVEIFKNQCIIERTLYKLQNSNIPWTFSSGGFEHSSFGATKKYFEQFKKATNEKDKQFFHSQYMNELFRVDKLYEEDEKKAKKKG